MKNPVTKEKAYIDGGNQIFAPEQMKLRRKEQRAFLINRFSTYSCPLYGITLKDHAIQSSPNIV
jgi:hypothetical protein